MTKLKKSSSHLKQESLFSITQKAKLSICLFDNTFMGTRTRDHSNMMINGEPNANLLNPDGVHLNDR